MCRKSFVLVALLVMILPFAAIAQGRPASVVTEVVSTREMSETVSVFGEIVAGRESAVAARVSGISEEVPLQVGDRVARGDVLARVDTELLEIQVAQAVAEVEIAEAGEAVVQARLDRAQKALRRAESLRANSAIAEVQLEDRASEFAEAIGAIQQAASRLQSAQAALRRARYDLENAVVRAPFDGVVLEVATEVGQFVSAGSKVAMLVDTGAMEVEANVPSRYIGALQPDQPVQAGTDVGDTLTLRLRSILPTEFSATRTRPVIFSIVGPETTIAAGQSVTLEVPVSAPRNVVVVPKDALVQAGGGWQVFVHQDGKAMPRAVEIGAAIGNAFEVLTGLAPGDEVVVRGNERLRPGQEIAPTAQGTGGVAPGQGGEATGAAAPGEEPPAERAEARVMDRG